MVGCQVLHVARCTPVVGPWGAARRSHGRSWLAVENRRGEKLPHDAGCLTPASTWMRPIPHDTTLDQALPQHRRSGHPPEHGRWRPLASRGREALGPAAPARLVTYSARESSGSSSGCPPVVLARVLLLTLGWHGQAEVVLLQSDPAMRTVASLHAGCEAARVGIVRFQAAQSRPSTMLSPCAPGAAAPMLRRPYSPGASTLALLVEDRARPRPRPRLGAHRSARAPRRQGVRLSKRLPAIPPSPRNHRREPRSRCRVATARQRAHRLRGRALHPQSHPGIPEHAVLRTQIGGLRCSMLPPTESEHRVYDIGPTYEVKSWDIPVASSGFTYSTSASSSGARSPIAPASLATTDPRSSGCSDSRRRGCAVDTLDLFKEVLRPMCRLPTAPSSLGAGAAPSSRRSRSSRSQRMRSNHCSAPSPLPRSVPSGVSLPLGPPPTVAPADWPRAGRHGLRTGRVPRAAGWDQPGRERTPAAGRDRAGPVRVAPRGRGRQMTPRRESAAAPPRRGRAASRHLRYDASRRRRPPACRVGEGVGHGESAGMRARFAGRGGAAVEAPDEPR